MSQNIKFIAKHLNLGRLEMKSTINIITITLILCAGALFGFFYTMSISIMPGLDLTAPYSAILANQEIGHATQNYFFAVPMIGTPLLAAFAAIYYFRQKDKSTAFLFLGTISAWVGMLVVTLMLNVPLNQILDGLQITMEQENLAQLWDSYSIDWQVYNWLRVGFSGLSLFFAAIAFKSSVIDK